MFSRHEENVMNFSLLLKTVIINISLLERNKNAVLPPITKPSHQCHDDGRIYGQNVGITKTKVIFFVNSLEFYHIQ